MQSGIGDWPVTGSGLDIPADERLLVRARPLEALRGTRFTRPDREGVVEIDAIRERETKSLHLPQCRRHPRCVVTAAEQARGGEAIRAIAEIPGLAGQAKVVAELGELCTAGRPDGAEPLDRDSLLPVRLEGAVEPQLDEEKGEVASPTSLVPKIGPVRARGRRLGSGRPGRRGERPAHRRPAPAAPCSPSRRAPTPTARDRGGPRGRGRRG